MLSVIGFLALLFIIAFLLGSIPWGVVISRVFFHTDVREHGSHNIGATNAVRTIGKVGGSAVFILDFAKGVVSGLIAVLFATSVITDASAAREFCQACGIVGANPEDAAVWLGLKQVCLAVAFLGCILGHIFTPWLKFKGGKGVAVAVGCLFSTFGPLGALLELVIFIIVVAATRYVSAGSIIAALACPFFSLYFFGGNWPAIIICTVAALIVIWAHRENIGRLRAGTESKIGSKKKAA